MKAFKIPFGVLLIITWLFAQESGWGMEKWGGAPEKGYKEGEILVKFKKEVPEARIQEMNNEMGTEILKFFRFTRFYLLKLPPGATVESMMEKFRALPEVEHVEPNSLVTIQQKP